MYHPYFYGRQSELLAVRDIAPICGSEDRVAPVIEPVRSSDGTLAKTLEVTAQHQLPCYVIVNPRLGDFSKPDDETKQWLSKWAKAVNSLDYVYPTYLADPASTPRELNTFLTRYPDQRIGIVVRNSAISMTDLAAQTSAYRQQRRFFLIGANPTQSTLTSLGKSRCVHIEDRFVVQARNALYAGTETFTDSHLTFTGNGYAGFGDYTILTNEFTEGGGPPGAVAIHLTYLNQRNKEIHVEHFVSDTTDQAVHDNNLKFMEAARKIPPAIRRPGVNFGDTAALKKYLAAYANSSPPNLAGNKRWEIAHHLELVSGILVSRIR